MSGNLFSEFSPSDKNAWYQQVEKELKGSADDLKSWKIDETINISPYLTLEDLDEERTLNIQNCQKKTPGWLNLPVVNFTDPGLTNSEIKTSIASGAQGIILNIKNKDFLECQFSRLLHSVRLSETPVYFETEQNSNELFDLIAKGSGYYIKGGVAHDSIAYWMRTGKHYDKSIYEIIGLLKKTKDMREFYPFMVESHIYHNSGATPVQELAFLISTMVSYIDMLTDTGISPSHALNRFFFSVSVGPEYLTEIAKLRALRFLFQKVCHAYQLPADSCNVFIHTTTSSFYNTEQLPHNNMVRSTSEAMSAVIGGCNALTVKPYNDDTNRSDDFSHRIARNVSLLLSNESYLSQVADPAAGSYFIEKLTLQLADAAWLLFLDIEKNGGMITCFENGIIQDKIEKSWNEKLTLLQSDGIIVGVNKYGSNKYSAPSSKVSNPVLEKVIFDGISTLPIRNLAQHWHSV